MANFNRISSIDIMRGLMLFLMLLFNYPGNETLPSWLSSQKGNPDLFGQTCWIFPAFLFLAGISVPYAISARISRGERRPDIMKHIFIRFISLIIIGVLLLNIARLDSEITGMNRNLWSLAVFAGIFLVWNDYREKADNFFTITGLKLFGMAALTFLVFKFRSGQPENDGSLIISWWGFPGLIGWGYMVAGLIYIFFRNSTFMILIITLGFLALNILSDLSMIRLPEIASSLFGVVTGGHVPFVALSGVLTGMIIRNHSSAGSRKAILVLSGMMVALAAAGILILTSAILQPGGTTAITLLSSAACLLIYIVLYLIADVRKPGIRAGLIMLAGENPLTTYIAPLLVYYIILISGLPVLFFKDSESMPVVAAGSIIWALLMILLTALLSRLNIRLKL